MSRRLFAALLLGFMVPQAAAARTVVQLADPRGDDHGDGHLVYPSQGFARGDLDLTGFTVENKRDSAVFTVEFAGRIKQPQRGAADELGTDFTLIARHGFYQFNIDIYIDTDRRPGSGFTRLLPGRLATVAPDAAWDVAVIATPRPELIRGLLPGVLPDEPGLRRQVHFPANFRVRGRRLSFEVPHDVLGGAASDTWAYTVFVTAADLQPSLELMSGIGLSESQRQQLGVLPVSPGEWTNRIGGGRPGEPLQPPVLDIFMPPGQAQEHVLADFSSRHDRPVVLPGVVPAATATAPAAADDEPRWALGHWDGRVGYQIFVRSFQDSDGDGIGDVNGLIERLDYLNDGDPSTDTDLGIEAIWLLPIFPSPSYHGYDVIDYERVNPQYGTDADFDRLVRECRRRGIEVVLDLMLNHTSSQHPWFVESKRGPDSPKRDWYLWRQDDPGWTQPWGGSNATWHAHDGWYYYGVFWGGMPDLNFRNPAVMEEAKRLSRLWLDRGVGGFRLDAARHLIETGPGQEQNDTPETHAAWREYSRFMRSEYPDRLMLGEIWAGPAEVAPYYGDAARVSGGDSFAMTFNFALGGGIVQAVNLSDHNALTAVLVQMATLYPPGVLDGTFLANHDMTRLATQLGGNPSKLRQAAALLLTLPGTPWLYYGEEVGLLNGPGGRDEFKRTPMPWADDDRAFTAGVPWHPFAPGREVANVAAQRDDPGSLLAHYRRLIRLRQQEPAVRRGTVTLVTLDRQPRAAVAYLREVAEQRVLVAHNLADEPVTLSWTLDPAPAGYRPLYGDHGVGVPVSGAVTMPARSTGVWELLR